MKKQYLYIGGLVALLITGLILVFVLNGSGEEEDDNANSTPTITIDFRSPEREQPAGSLTQTSQTTVITATVPPNQEQGETPIATVVNPVDTLVPAVTSIPVTNIPSPPAPIPAPDTPEWVQWCQNCVEQNCPDTSNCTACPPECVSYYLTSIANPTIPPIPTEIPEVPFDPIPDPPVEPPVPDPPVEPPVPGPSIPNILP